MKVYDCFPFFNEIDLLEIRLQELWNNVDVFVITESNFGYSGKFKPYNFKNNQERFAPYISKIRYIEVNDMPNNGNAWDNEYWQRNAAVRQLDDLTSEDIVIISDCDEIPRSEAIDLIKNDTNNWDRYILAMPMFQYKINYMKIYDRSVQRNIIVVRGRSFTTPLEERRNTFWWVTRPPKDTTYIDHAGWHFTYFGDDNSAIEKLQNFSHIEEGKAEITNSYNIDKFIENKCCHARGNNTDKFEYAIVDEYFPESITKNLQEWAHMIIPNATYTVEELYEVNPRKQEIYV